MNGENELGKERIEAFLKGKSEKPYTNRALFINIDEKRISLQIQNNDPEELWRVVHSIVSSFGISSNIVILLVDSKGNVLKKMATLQRHTTTHPLNIKGRRYKVVKIVDSTEYIINTFDTIPEADMCLSSILNFVIHENDGGYVIENEYGDVVDTEKEYAGNLPDMLSEDSFEDELPTYLDDFPIFDDEDSMIPDENIFDEDPSIKKDSHDVFTVWLEETSDEKYLHINIDDFYTIVNITNKRGFLVGCLDMNHQNFEYEIIEGDEEEIVFQSIKKFENDPGYIWAILVADIEKIDIVMAARNWQMDPFE